MKKSALKAWRVSNRYSQAGFAKFLCPFVVDLCKELKIPAPKAKVAGAHIQKWENGCEPRLIYAMAIERATNGMVKPWSFL